MASIGPTRITKQSVLGLIYGHLQRLYFLIGVNSVHTKPFKMNILYRLSRLSQLRRLNVI